MNTNLEPCTRGFRARRLRSSAVGGMVVCALLVFLPLLAMGQGALSNGGNHDGVISTNDVDTWTFSANAGDSVVLRLAELAATNIVNFIPGMRLHGPGSVLLGTDVDATVAEIAVTITNSGSFEVLVHDGPDGTSTGIGPYRLHFAQFPGAFVVAEDGGSLTNGGNHEGAVHKGDLDLWSFGADTGDYLVLRIAELSDDNGQFVPWVRFYGPSGVELGSASGAQVAEIAVPATNSGTFTVLVSDATGGTDGFDDTGTYRLHVAKFPGAFIVADDGGSLTNGGNHDGTILLGDLDLWSLAVNSGDHVFLRIAELSDDNGQFAPWLRWYGPDGKLLASELGALVAEVALTATNSGVFTALVSDGSGGGGINDTGSYRLHVAKFPGTYIVADEGGSIPNGVVQNGTILLGDLDIWSFFASANNSIAVQVTELTQTNLFGPSVRLYGPTGTALGDDSGTVNATVNHGATNSGVYFALVGDSSGGGGINGTGTYQITVSGISGPAVFTSVGLSEGELVASGSGGGSNGVYWVVSSTNIALPLVQWIPVATNQFAGDGSFVFTNSINLLTSQEFFRLAFP